MPVMMAARLGEHTPAVVKAYVLTGAGSGQGINIGSLRHGVAIRPEARSHVFGGDPKDIGPLKLRGRGFAGRREAAAPSDVKHSKKPDEYTLGGAGHGKLFR